MANNRPDQNEFALAAEPALPILTAEQAALVDAVAVMVRNAYVAGGLTTLLAIGRIVLDAMFDGDIDRFKAIGTGKRHASYFALSKRDDIGISASSLWYAVALHDNVRLLGQDDAQRIPTSHHRVLVHVRDVETRKDLARRTIAENLTVKKLAALVPPRQVVEPGKRGRGRPALPVAVKALGELERIVGGLPEVTPQSVHGVEGEDVAEMRARVEKVRTAANEWLAKADAQLSNAATAKTF